MAILLTLSPACKTDSTDNGVKNRPDLAELVFNGVNTHRQLAGLPALTWQSIIADLAAEHSLQMAQGLAPFGHQGFEARVSTLRASFTFGTAGENVGYASGYENPIDIIVDGWMQKSEHRANILGTFSLTGIGAAEGLNGEIFVTQIFLRSPQ